LLLASAGVAHELLRASTELVLINAAVVDRHDRLVNDLEPGDFRIVEDDVEQRIVNVWLEDVPVSIIIVMDLSGSMSDSLSSMKAAIAELSRAHKPDDEYMLISVKDDPAVELPFADSTDEIQNFAIKSEARGATALIDALMLAFQQVNKARNTRKAILVLSDGHDTASRYTWAELRNIAREAGVPVYAFSLPSEANNALFGLSDLEKVVNDTGGRHVLVKNPSLFAEKLQGLDLHRQYVLSYFPSNRLYDGKYRRVEVDVEDAERKLKVFWRRGYHAPPVQ
jgi:Ca-activated chloride channel family protein